MLVELAVSEEQDLRRLETSLATDVMCFKEEVKEDCFWAAKGSKSFKNVL